MKAAMRWMLGLGIAALITAGPYVYYRVQYTTGKRLREVTPGVLYRSGQMTEDGFAEAVAHYHIRTILNVQDEYPDPDIARGYFDRRTVKETELCRRLGVRYLHLSPDLIPRHRLPEEHPAAIDGWRAILDDPSNYPILIHCKAGLHRTGILVAVYRMEYEGWTPQAAIRELKDNGFGEYVCSSANDYILEYILAYRPRSQKSEVRGQESGVRNQESEVRNQRPSGI